MRLRIPQRILVFDMDACWKYKKEPNCNVQEAPTTKDPLTLPKALRASVSTLFIHPVWQSRRSQTGNLKGQLLYSGAQDNLE